MWLVIKDLAQQPGVSPISVREALQQLDADGYVVMEPYLGAH
jgi:DNA-binding GntR family transcriptional regulator